MLKSIYIKNLFGLYTYTLNLNSKCGDSIRFITGPNGYGKTTILNILNSLYSWDLQSLSLIPFETLRLLFNDSCVVDVQRICNYVDKEFSDEFASEIIELHIKFNGDNGHTKISSTTWSSDNEGEIEENNSLLIYLKSHPIYYITDKRLQKDESSLMVNINAKKLQGLLRDYRVQINEVSNKTSFSTKYLTQEEDNTKIDKDSNALKFCGFTHGKVLPSYREDSTEYLNTQVENVFDSNKEQFINKLECFLGIIKRSDFADKQLQLSPQYGYRFVLNDEDKTIILPKDLSSGEQHILIMAYDLLFNAADDSLILIDEPELSLHLAWQLDFLKNLSEITSLRNLQCIVSTHSPQVFSNKFNLAIDLYKQSIAQETN